MTDVLALAAVKPEWASMLRAAAELRQAGARVRLACAFDPRGLPRGDLAEVHQLAIDLRTWHGRRPRRYTPLWAWILLRNRVIRARLARSTPVTKTWLLARGDPWIRRQLRQADVLVAIENRAVYTAWRLARRSGDTAALLGTRPALAGLEGLRLFTGVASANSLRTRTAAEVLGAWQSAKASLGAAGRGRLLDCSPRVVRALRRSKAFDEAETLVRSALALRPDSELTTWLRLELTAIQIAMLVGPDYPLEAVVTKALSTADTHLRRGRHALAVDLAISVAETVFHRELHAEVESSPLTDDPKSYLAPLRSSLVYRALCAPRGSLSTELRGCTDATGPQRPRSAQVPSASRHTPQQGPRLLVVSGGNLRFAKGILNDLQQVRGAEIRQLVLPENAQRFGRRDLPSMMVDRIAEAFGGARETLELAPEDADLLSWPDTVFVDWCDNAAMWTLLHVPREVRAVVRIHSIEAVSHQPHMMDWSRVSDVIFVGAHVCDFMMRAVPSMKRAARIHVVPNEIRLERFGLPKRPDAARTIAMVGWGYQVKDATWAVELLARLRAHNADWRLLLIGQDFADSQTVSGARYRTRFRERAEEADVRDGINIVGYVDDLPEALRDAGFVISASRRESFGVGLAEGAASAALPVVRNWPLYARYGGARAVYPSDWVVENLDEAFERVVMHSDRAIRQLAGDRARGEVLERFDWPVVAPRYREILLGEARRASEKTPLSTGLSLCQDRPMR